MDSRTDDLQSILARCSTDERAAFEVIARKVMGQGRKTYGPTVLSNDPRDFRREAADELVDALFYWSLEEVKRLARPPQQMAIEMVRDFHLAFGQPIASTPSISNPDTNELRVKLLDEEVGELEVALAERDPVAVLDALADIQYVLDGAFLSLGFAEMKDAAMAEVHRSNMSKLGADGRPVLREGDSKVLKGPNYSPPDLVAIVKGHAPRQRFQELAAAMPELPTSLLAGSHALPQPSASFVLTDGEVSEIFAEDREVDLVLDERFDVGGAPV